MSFEVDNLKKEIRKFWYSQTYILFEVIKCCNHREIAFIGAKSEKEHLPAIRCVKAYSIDFLKKNFEAFRFYQRNFNFYNTISFFTDFPMFSFNPQQRKQELGDFFNGGGFDKVWKGIDFVMDIDNEDLKEAHKDATKVKKVLDEFNVPYSLRFSGRRGFHFVCQDNKFFPLNMPNEEKIKVSHDIVKGIKIIEDIPSIDVTIYDRERLLKTPFTLTNENVCLPLSDKDFAEFEESKMHYKYVLSHYPIKNRGLLERQSIINFERLYNIYGKRD